MIQIRSGVFETNSSSTHSMTVCMKSDFERFKNGEMLFQYYKDKFVETESIPQDDIDSDRYLTYDQWCSKESGLESFMETFKTPNGEEIIIFGEYGYDG